MAEANQDMWSQWLLQRRFGGDPQRLQLVMGFLYPIRDKVLEHAALADYEVLLDVGCGDGLIAFGALEKVPTSQVIFSDISPELLAHAEEIAREIGVRSRCQFLQAAADNLSEVPSAAVDVVTTRSVLIYVADKHQAFAEFSRVLKPQGRLSIFEPINRFGQPEPPHQFWGYDVAPVRETADKLKELYRELQPLETDPMLNFDERDLLALAEQAGFKDLHLELQVQVTPPPSESAGGAHRGRVDLGHREPAPAHQHGDLMRVYLVVLRLPAVDGLHIESVAQNKGDPFLGAEIREPVPSEDTLHRPTTRSSRYGAMTRKKASGVAGRFLCTTIVPAWSRIQTDIDRACRDRCHNSG